MKASPIELFVFLNSHAEAAKYDLAESNLPALTLGELGPVEDLDFSWSCAEGSPELKKLIARISHVPEDWVLVTQGASEANFLLGLALLEEGSRVVVERPFYEPLWKVFQLLGAQVSQLPRSFEGGFALPVDRLAESLPPDTRLLVFTNLYNPGGTLEDGAVLEELADLAEERDFHILVDEVFREAAFERAPPCALTISQRFIVTSSPSKFYGLGGLRIGWCLATSDILNEIGIAKTYTTMAPSTLSDTLARRALGMREKVRVRNRRLIEQNRRLVDEWIAEQSEVEWVPPDSHISLPRFRGDVERLVSVALTRHGTLIAPGRFFGDSGHFRLCFGMNTQELRAGLEALTRAVKDV